MILGIAFVLMGSGTLLYGISAIADALSVRKGPSYCGECAKQIGGVDHPFSASCKVPKPEPAK